MKNLRPFVFVVALLLAVQPIFGQPVAAPVITNGTFETGDFTGWQTTVGPLPGSPAVLMGGAQNVNGTTTTVLAPATGTFQAFIQSTGGASLGQAIDIAALETFVGVGTLPNSAVAGGVPISGTAIQQTFTNPFTSAKLSFAYAYQSREVVGDGVDETGYVLNGVFHVLVDTNTPGVQAYNPNNGIFKGFLPYQTMTVNIPAGANTLSFLSYNTVITFSTTALLIDDVIVTPLFSTMPGLTPNQHSVATNIDNNDPSTSPKLNTIVTALGGATSPAALGDFLDQLSPQSLQVFRRIAFDNATFNTLDVTNHLANLRDGLTGFDPSQLSVVDSSMTAGGSRIKSHLTDAKDMMDAKQMRDTKEMAPAPAAPDPWSTFIVGNVLLADLSHDQDLAHQDYTSSSVLLGTDFRFDEHFTVGALLDYSHTDADLDHIGSKATVDSYSPGVYASYVDGGWYANALFAYTFNSYTDDRNLNLPDLTGTNHGAAQGNQYTGSLLGGYEFRSGDLKYGPFASVQYVNLGINSFTEDGPTALDVQSQSDDSFRTQLGFDVRYSTRVGSVVVVPHGSFAWQHECLNNDTDITSDFANIGASTFTVQATHVGRNSAVIDVGLDAGICRNVTLFTDYATEAGADHYFGQSISAGVRVGF